MAKTYNTIGTFTSGQVLTAVQMNGIGTNVNNYRVPPLCRARRNATQAIANNTQRLINFDTEDIDTDGIFTASSVTFTVQTAGVYLVTCCVTFAVNFTSTRGVQIVVNPTISGTGDSANVTAGTRIAETMVDVSPATQTGVTATTIYSLAVNDTLGFIAYQNSGGNLNIPYLTGEQTTASIAWLGQAS